jgi:cell division ATPase FtsA
LSQEEKDAGVVLVDMGGGTTDLAIFKDGRCRSWKVEISRGEKRSSIKYSANY